MKLGTKTQYGSYKNLISVLDLTLSDIISLCNAADIFKKIVKNKGGCDMLRYRILATYFSEPSTRSLCSFHAAMLRLGGNVINVDNNHSSIKKGESLTDTIRTLNSYCDAIVLRHPHVHSTENAASVSCIPVINAGDGTGEHPSQSLVDVYTILCEFGHIGDYFPFTKSNGKNNGKSTYDQNNNQYECNMTIVVVGDLKHGRTVHSLVQLLAQFNGIQFIFVSPINLRMPDHIIEYIKELGAKIAFTTKLTNEIVSVDQNNNQNDALSQADVVYMTRIQKERFENETEYNNVKGLYILNKELLARAKPEGSMIVMHPLPRVDEIHVDLDDDPRSAYIFRQMNNGMYMRMAILHWLVLDKLIPDQIDYIK